MDNENQEEVTLLEVRRYRCPDGKPTCGSNFEIGAICRFLRTRLFGSRHECSEAPTDGRNGFESVYADDGKDGTKGTGFIRPCEQCVVWKGIK